MFAVMARMATGEIKHNGRTSRGGERTKKRKRACKDNSGVKALKGQWPPTPLSTCLCGATAPWPTSPSGPFPFNHASQAHSNAINSSNNWMSTTYILHGLVNAKTTVPQGARALVRSRFGSCDG
jgi:hypothetical protein